MTKASVLDRIETIVINAKANMGQLPARLYFACKKGDLGMDTWANLNTVNADLTLNMSHTSSNSSGFGNNPPRGPSLYDPERAAEMTRLNASMTPATTNSRAGRGISAATRGGRGGHGRGNFSNVGGD